MSPGPNLPQASLPAATRIGKVRLAVSNLEESIRFYRDVIGLSVVRLASENLALLGASPAGEHLLELEALPGVKPLGNQKRIGLYHTAFLLPARTDLSNFIAHLNRLGVPYGASDHLVSEALYLTDPDGLTVEVYADRDRSQWSYRASQITAATLPLKFAELPPVSKIGWQAAPPSTAIGHLHFYVSNLQAARGFYHAAMGFDIVNASLPGALFVSAGGYHHHVGLNTWAAGSPKASAQDARILFWELLLPDQDQADLVAQRLKAAASIYSETAKSEPAFTDSHGISVIVKSAAGQPITPELKAAGRYLATR